MCGIAGFWGKNQLNTLRIESGLKEMCHRGPDDRGYKSFITEKKNHISLLFTRLAIIDLDPRANQPMGYGGLWLTFNGEIYNYIEIRNQLEIDGIKFQTSSDTEVLLKGLYSHGWKFLERLEGMWAISVYDEITNRLTLCRDRFGEKPLAYIKTPTGIFYASELKTLENLSGNSLIPNKLHLQRFLVNGYKSLYKTEETFFEGVINVPEKSLIHFNDDGTIDNEIYWNPNYTVNEDIGFDEAVQLTREKLLQSINLRLRADVPLAFTLSGGVDSVALVSLAKRELGVDLQAFTVDIPSHKYNEYQITKKVVNELGIQHDFLKLDKGNFLADLETITRHRKSPILTLSSYMQWLLMDKISNSGFKIVIGGIGADEIFTGYYDHHLYYIAQIDKNLRNTALLNWQSKIRSYVQNPFLSNPDLFITSPFFRDYIYLNSDVYRTYLVDDFRENFSEMYFVQDVLRNRMLNEMYQETVPVLLNEEDLNSMYYSIENRSPYLDKGLFETVNKFSSKLLIKDGVSKSILRESVRGIAPNFVLNNSKKIGFNAPIEDFINLDDQNVKNSILQDSSIFEIVNKKSIELFLNKRNLTNSESKFLFVFLSSKAMLDYNNN